MIFKQTKLDGVFIIDVKRIEDARGFFGRVWCKEEFEEHGLNPVAVQANVSYNPKKGTLRGMHYQIAPFGECKTVRCTAGSILDVVIDIRPDSPTFKQWLSVELTGLNFRMLYVPEGFAHGYLTLEDHSSVHYTVSQYYSPKAERGIRYNDPSFNIDWKTKIRLVSPKDKAHPLFEEQNVMSFIKSDSL